MKDVSQEYIEHEEGSTKKPAELYHIWRDGGQHWYYTSGDVVVVYNSNTYEPATIERDMVQYNSDLEVSNLRVRAAQITTPVIEFIVANPVELLWIEVLRIFRDQDPLEASVIFVGQIKSVAFKGAAAEVECVGFEFFLKQPIPRYRYQPGCNNTLYDEKCTVVKASYAVNATLSAVSSDGMELESTTFGSYDDDWFRFGYLEYGDYKRMITEHKEEKVKIRYRIPGLAVNDTVTVYAGCDLTVETCEDKFSNMDNFFGHPHIPLDNPTMWLP